MRRAIASRRGGFTLIEMLVVIGIIILLVGLLLPAVQKARDAAMRARVKNEMNSGVGSAIENFKSTYDVKYIPPFFILTNNYNPQAGDSAAMVAALNESREFYSKVWPKAFIPGAPGMTPLAADTGPGTPDRRIKLDGNQCLVFFLGGVPPASNPLPPTGQWPASFQGTRSGFLNSPTNPFGFANGTENSPPQANMAKGPFYDFDVKRVDVVFGHFHDPYWKPTNDPNDPGLLQSIYYYFSSKHGNDYDYWGRVYSPAFNPAINIVGGYGGMNPLIGLDGKYVETAGYQLISAGKDQVPGPGTQFLNLNPRQVDPNTLWPGGGAYKMSPGGADDLANFSNYVLSSDK